MTRAVHLPGVILASLVAGGVYVLATSLAWYPAYTWQVTPLTRACGFISAILAWPFIQFASHDFLKGTRGFIFMSLSWGIVLYVLSYLTIRLWRRPGRQQPG